MATARLVSASGSTDLSHCPPWPRGACSTSESAAFGPFTLTTWLPRMAVTQAGMAKVFPETRHGALSAFELAFELGSN